MAEKNCFQGTVEALMTGMNGFVSKPFKIKELTEVLQKVWE